MDEFVRTVSKALLKSTNRTNLDKTKSVKECENTDESKYGRGKLALHPLICWIKCGNKMDCHRVSLSWKICLSKYCKTLPHSHNSVGGIVALDLSYLQSL